MIAIGFDLGLTGAIAFTDGHSSDVEDLPIMEDATGQRCIDARALSELVSAHCAGVRSIGAYEDVRVRAMPGRITSHSSEGLLVRCRGVVEGVLGVLCIQPAIVQPQTWKTFYGLLGQEKDTSREKACALYPNLQASFKRVKDHNRAEAMLIAHYALRKLT